jgi:predicted O-methyltransferase YrrM
MTRLADQLTAKVAEYVAAGLTRVAVLGLTAEGLAVTTASSRLGGEVLLFDPDALPTQHRLLAPWRDLAQSSPDVVVIAADRGKERLLRAAADVLDGMLPLPRVVLGGLGHQNLRDPDFEKLEAPALVPSYATGHPQTRAHLYDCLRSAATHGRSGAVVELGAFKCGTSVWLAKAIRQLGLRNAPVIAFDAWDGFPPRRSLLDLYEHPRCVFRDLEAVRRYTEPYNIELVPGDIFETAPARLARERILLAFVDTDNYSGARAALTAIVPNLVRGGAIVLDHFVTTRDYVYTIGERLAALETLRDAHLLNLQGTGVFFNVG